MSKPGHQDRPLRVAVIGSGPSGFYAAAGLLKQDSLTAKIDIFDRLPTPFGLVRGGVAPDHQKIKNVIRVYNKTAAHENVRFFGNVCLGRDLPVEALAQFYDQIVWAIGNESDRKMNIEGEELAGVHSATEFVGWYNGHPDFQDREFDLSSAKSVAVVGNGNVAMDVTRILAQDPDELAVTDITESALQALRVSQVTDIWLLGRRGPAQAAFSPKEIKEIGEIECAELLVDPLDTQLDELSAAWLEQAATSAKKNVEYLKQTATESKSAEAAVERRVHCRFLVSPVAFRGENGRVSSIVIEKNELYADEAGTPRPRGTGEQETIAADFIFKAVGYRGEPLEGLPFDDRRGLLPNDEGRLLDGPDGDPIVGQYVVGWAKRGPSGLIGTNGPDSEATVVRMMEDLEAGALLSPEAPDPNSINEYLEQLKIDYVTFDDWTKLDADEVARGEARGKVREKYTSVDSMMAAIRQLR